MPFLSAYHLTWVSLSLYVGYLFTAAPAKRSIAPYLGCGFTPLSCTCAVSATVLSTHREKILPSVFCLFICFLFYSGPQEIRGCSPMLGRAICFTQFSNKNANHSRKHSYKPRNNIILAIWTILNPVKLIHEINCHRRTFHFITWNI